MRASIPSASEERVRPQARIRLHPCPLILALLLASCAAATYDTHDDLTISTHVKIALIDDARLGAFQVNAATSRGVVTLQGSVPTQADVDHAMAIARRVRGVKDVRSELEIQRLEVRGLRPPTGLWPLLADL